MSKLFSLILNSRARPKLLSNLLDSILNTTADPTSIEVKISCDKDDILTKEYFEKFNPFWGGNLPEFASIEFIYRERNMHVRMNQMAKEAQSKWIWILNDDCEIKTENWDIECNKILSETYTDIVLGHVECSSIDKENNCPYSSFPIISKKHVDILNYLITPLLPGLGGDVFLYRIYNELDRIVKLPIYIRHILHENLSNILNCDLVAAEMRQETKMAQNCWNINIKEPLEKLRKYIDVPILS